MKRVLMVSELFYPSNEIGALRPSKICKFLTEKGIAVDVITAYPVNSGYDTQYFRAFSVEVAQQSECVGPETSANKRTGNGVIGTELKRLKRTLLSYRKGKHYARKALVYFENGTLHAEDYDACFTTFGPVSSVLIGLELKRKYHIKNWICDFRDPMAVKMCSTFMFLFYKYIQNKACQYADKIVAVSNGYVRRICGERYSEKTYMIPNGYDIADKVVNHKKEKNKKLTFAYVGSLYEGKRDISPIFRALSELCADERMNPSNVQFVYAGGDYGYLVEQANQYQMQQVLMNCGKLSRDACLKLQQDADFLVLSTWNERGEEGVFPGKFLEYMLIGRPIISLTCGDLADGEVTSVMREGDLGIAYESVKDDTDYPKLKEYIRNAYDQYICRGEVNFSPRNETIERYSWDNLIERIEQLL